MDKMKLVVFLIALISWIVISKMVFQKVRRDYTEQGKLTKLSSFLQLTVFALHAQLFTCSYWDLSLVPADKYLSVSYWLKTAPDFSGSFISLIIGSCLAVAGILILGLGFKGLESFARADGQRVDKLISKDIYQLSKSYKNAINADCQTRRSFAVPSLPSGYGKRYRGRFAPHK